MANETKSQLRDALLAHGLPVAWAEWATRMQFEAERPNTIHYESHRPEPPKRTVTAWDDDGDPREYTRTDVEMVEAWEEYQRELNDWREKHGDAATVTKSAPGGPTHYRIELSCPGVTLDLIATRAEGPWRADRLSGYWVPDVLKPVEAVVGAWFGPDGAMKTETVNAGPKPRQPPAKPPCYIAGPFRGASHWDVAQNVRRAEAVALAAWRSGLFSWVYCPHLNTAHFQDTAPDDVWIEGHLEAMRAVHREGGVVLVVKGWARSTGTRAELEEAHRIGMPAFQYQGDDCDMVAGVRQARKLCRDIHLTTWVTSEISQTLSSYLAERAKGGK